MQSNLRTWSTVIYQDTTSGSSTQASYVCSIATMIESGIMQENHRKFERLRSNTIVQRENSARSNGSPASLILIALNLIFSIPLWFTGTGPRQLQHIWFLQYLIWKNTGVVYSLIDKAHQLDMAVVCILEGILVMPTLHEGTNNTFGFIIGLRSINADKFIADIMLLAGFDKRMLIVPLYSLPLSE